MTGTAIPTSSEELEDLLNDTSRMTDILKEGKLGEVTAAYTKAQMSARNEELTKQVREAAQLGMQQFLKANKEEGYAPSAKAWLPNDPLVNKAMSPAVAKRMSKAKLFNKRALGAQLDKQPYAESIGKFLQAIWHKAEEKNPDIADELKAFKRVLRNAMSERVPSEGGFLVPEMLRSQILMIALEDAIVRPRARNIPMDSLRVPYPTIDDTSHTSSVYGGVIGYWTEEAAALTASQPSFGRIVLEAKKLTAYTEIPNELLQDAIDALNQWFEEMFPTALAWFEDVAFLGGSGVGEPQGVMNSPCKIAVSRTTSNEVQFADVAKMYPRMLPSSLRNAVWLCSPDVIGQLLQLTLTSGSTPVAPPLWLQGMQAVDEVDYTLLGRPLFVSEKLSALGVEGDLAFVDFGYYLLGDRQTMQISSSDEYKFANDVTAFRVIERLDGRTWIQTPLTPENGGNTLSPVVVLD